MWFSFRNWKWTDPRLLFHGKLPLHLGWAQVPSSKFQVFIVLQLVSRINKVWVAICIHWNSVEFLYVCLYGWVCAFVCDFFGNGLFFDWTIYDIYIYLICLFNIWCFFWRILVFSQRPKYSNYFLGKFPPPDLNSWMWLAVSDVMIILIGQNRIELYDTLVYECVCVRCVWGVWGCNVLEDIGSKRHKGMGGGFHYI